MGGMLKAIERGYVQQEIQNAAYEYQPQVDRQEAIVVGVNRFTIEKEDIPIQRIDGRWSQASRTPACVTGAGAIPAMEDSLRTGRRCRPVGANLMPHIVRAVEAYATVGEISDTLRKCWGV